jgi:chromosomal replication initiation ATPase DnaA
MKEIIQVVVDVLDVSMEDIMSKSRKIEHVEARAIAAHLMRKCDMKHAEIARALGCDTHTSSIYWLNMIDGEKARKILNIKRRKCEERAKDLCLCV